MFTKVHITRTPIQSEKLNDSKTKAYNTTQNNTSTKESQPDLNKIKLI